MTPSPAPPPPQPRRGRRAAGSLAAGSAVGGVLAYVFFVVVIRALGPGPAAPVAVLWAWWGFAGAALTFPVQHWITRTVATSAGEAVVRQGMRRVTVAVTVVSLVAGGVAWVAQGRLFGPDGAMFPLLVVGVGLGSGVLGVLRGVLAGRQRFAALAVGIVAENAVRCVSAVGVALTGNDSPQLYGLALLSGYVVAAGWPSALLPGRAHHAEPGGGPGSGPPVVVDTARGVLAFVTGASAGQVLAQAALTGGPVLLAALGGAPAQVTALFAALALFRAPYTLALGMVAALTGRLTTLVQQRRWATLAQIRRLGLVTTVVFALAGAAGGAWLGAPVMEAVFGVGVRLAPPQTALVAAGTVCALANLMLTVGLLARDRAADVVTSWLLASPFGAAAYLGLGTTALHSTCWTFLVLEVAAVLALLMIESRSDRLVRGQEHRRAEG